VGQRDQSSSQRWLGSRNSWRRIILTGIAGGMALAILAVLVSSVCGGGSGSLDEDEPTAVPTAVDVGPGANVPTDVPIETDVPVLDTPAPTATDEPVLEPTATAEVTPSPTPPLATETAVAPTPEATVKP